MDSESNLTALHTAVKVRAVFLSTETPLLAPLLIALIADRKSLFSFFLNKFVKKSVIAKIIVFGISQLYAYLFLKVCYLFAFLFILLSLQFLKLL